MKGDAAFVRDGSTWLAYSVLAFYTYLINALGPITPFLRADMNLDYTLASLHFSAFAVGMLLAGLSVDKVVARLGRQRTLWGGAVGMAGGALLLVAGRTPAVTIGACLVMGILGSALLIIVPAALSDQFGTLRAVALTEANTLASACATLAPFCIGALARTELGWRGALLVPVLALAVIAVGCRRQRIVEASRKEHAVPIHGGRLPSALPGAYWALWAVRVLVVSVEFCIILWGAELLENVKHLARPDAALSMSLFLGAMLAGRWLGGLLLRRVASKTLLLATLVLAGLGFMLHWQGESLPVVATGLVLAGLGVANLYPMTLALAVGAAPGQVERAAARSTLASGTAALAAPLVLGRLADLLGIGAAYGIIGALLVAAFGLIVVVGA